MSEMSPTPWTIERSAVSGNAIGVTDFNGNPITLCSGIGSQVSPRATLVTEQVVHAVNCHAEMVEALTLVRMSAGWQAMSADTRAIVEAALSKATQTETGQ